MMDEDIIRSLFGKIPGVETVNFDYINEKCDFTIDPCVWAAFLLFSFQPISIMACRYEQFKSLSNPSKYIYLYAERELNNPKPNEVKMTLRLDDFEIIDKKLDKYDFENYIERGDRVIFLPKYNKVEYNILRDGLFGSLDIILDYLTIESPIDHTDGNLNSLNSILKDNDANLNNEVWKEKTVEYLVELIDKGYVYIESLEKLYAYFDAVEKRKR